MNATFEKLPGITPPLPDGIGPVLGILVQAPFGLSIAQYLVSPLRCIFNRALDRQIAEPLHCGATRAGVFAFVVVRDVEACLAILRAEFAELGYSSIAHIGRLMPAPQGWVCLYGQPDQVTDFAALLHDTASTLESDMHTFKVHMAAYIGKE